MFESCDSAYRMAFLNEIGCSDFVADRIASGHTHQQIATELQQLYPGYQGLSARSVRRFCSTNKFTRSSHLSSSAVDEVVEQAVSQVGPAYGRRTLTGLLRSEGVIVAEQRVRQSLRRVAPVYIQHRRANSYHQFNPMPYYAEYYGHKMHLDQNEKLIHYGVTHIAASDGYSGKILGIVTMPIKNNLVIYEDLYRPIVLEHGLWDQVRVDCGREFALTLFVQQSLSTFRTNTQRAPYLQTSSTLNHRAERYWVEVNSRVNFPIKRALIDMQQHNTIDMDCPVTKFCVSMMTGMLCQVGLQTLISSWNNHHVPGRGIPSILAEQNNRASPVHGSVVPTVDEAVTLYTSSGGYLTPSSSFGCDPLSGHSSLQSERQRLMEQSLPSPEDLFGFTVNGHIMPFAQSLEFMIQKSFQLQP